MKLISNSDKKYAENEAIMFNMYKKHRHLTINVKPGVDRTLAQNRLQRMWLLEAQSQGDQTSEEYRGYCKLHFGVPIVRAEDDNFCEVYDRLIRPRAYQEKLELMMVPMDLPVTRIMTRDQKTRYLDAMYQYFTGLGFKMTLPNS